MAEAEKRIILELNEQDSAIIAVALELRPPPNNLHDRKRWLELKKELTAKHDEVFLQPRIKRRK